MEALWVELLSLSVAAAVLPLWIILTLLLLRSEGGLLKAAAFVSGATLVRLVQGVLFGLVFGAAAEESADAPNAIVSTLLLVVGIALLVSAVMKWRKEADPDDPPPKWMASLSGMSAPKTFAMGALLMVVAVKQWVFTLSAIAIVEQAATGPALSIFAFLAFVVLAQSLLVTPIIASAVAPTRSAKMLDAAQGWLQRNNRIIAVAASLIFGTWFLWKGIMGLLG